MDTSYIVMGLLIYAGYEVCKALSIKRPKSQGEVLAEALGVRVSSLEERVKKLEDYAKETEARA